MSRWRRAIIWTLTFLFGLYYLVDFLLPSEIGGAIDRVGVGSACAVHTSDGWYVYYTAIAGPLKPDGSPDDKLLQYRIVRFPLDRPSDRKVVLAPSPFRKGDYFGCKNPSVLFEDGEFRMWYVGLSYFDREPQVLYTHSRDGVHWEQPGVALTGLKDILYRQAGVDETHASHLRTIRREALSAQDRASRIERENARYERERTGAIEQTQWVAGGIQSICVRRRDGMYDLWFVANGPEGSSLGLSVSAAPTFAGIDQGPLLSVSKPVSVARASGGWFLVSHGKVLRIPELYFGDGRLGAHPQEITPVSVAVQNPVSVDVAEDGQTLMVVTSVQNQKQTLQVFTTSDGGQTWRPDSPPVEPGNPGFTVLPIPIGTIAGWVAVVTAFSVGIGLIGLLRIHLTRIGRRRPGWIDSTALITSMVAIGVSVVLYRLLPDANSGQRVDPGYRLWVERSYDLLWLNMQVPLTATTFALLAAFLVSAAYRAFRIRGRDATVLALSATIVLLAQVPVGDFLTSWMPPSWQEHVGIGSVRQWYLDLANSAVQRGIAFGIFVGSVAMALRIWLSLDRVGD